MMMKKMMHGLFLCAVAAASNLFAGGYDVAVYVWPAYHPEPRWRELGIFADGKGEWQSLYEAEKRKDGDIWGVKPLWGYTDESNPVDVAHKIDAAVASGVNVFIYDWYWYEGRPFLQGALENGFLKAKNNERMKFYVMWANHDVTGLWNNKLSRANGKDNVIWPAKVSEADYRKIVAHWINAYFTRPNYYKIDGKPVFMLYRLNGFVQWEGEEVAKARIAYLREEVKKAGFPGLHLQICGTRGMDCSKFDIDSVSVYNWGSSNWEGEFVRKRGFEPEYAQVGEFVVSTYLPKEKANVEKMGKVFFPNLSVGWDTNARYVKEDARPIIRNSNPRDFETYARKIRDWADKNIPANMPKLITVNSWNEWTEGGYLEPDSMFGYGYLDALRKVFVEEVK